VDNNKIDLREIGWSSMDWLELVQEMDQWKALVCTVMNPSGSIKCWEILE
jgi:hypothetical protein